MGSVTERRVGWETICKVYLDRVSSEAACESAATEGRSGESDYGYRESDDEAGFVFCYFWLNNM